MSSMLTGLHSKARILFVTNHIWILEHLCIFQSHVHDELTDCTCCKPIEYMYQEHIHS
jgi:hypothetical protein